MSGGRRAGRGVNDGVADVLPISGVRVTPRQLTGSDELYVLEHAGSAVATVVGLASRVCAADAQGSDGVANTGRAATAWPKLPAADVGALALLLRRAWLGDMIRTDSACVGPGCGERVDIAFGIGDYLGHRRPRTFRGASPAEGEPGWYVLAGAQTRFRLPTFADLLAVLDAADPQGALATRCVRPPQVPAAMARRIDRALAALAPVTAGEIGGACPVCDRELTLHFDPVTFVLAELRDDARFVYGEIAALAAATGWSERDLVAMPRARRTAYLRALARERVAI